MTSDGELTDDGRAFRKAVERQTDETGVAPWTALGEPGTQRLAELAGPLVATALANGAFPDGVFA